jgi:hypothetical protein
MPREENMTSNYQRQEQTYEDEEGEQVSSLDV